MLQGTACHLTACMRCLGFGYVRRWRKCPDCGHQAALVHQQNLASAQPGQTADSGGLT